MRTSLAMLIVLAATMPAIAAEKVERPAAARDTQQQTQQKMTGKDQQMQRDADKGAKTRNSGESGYVADEPKPGASSHPPGQPGK